MSDQPPVPPTPKSHPDGPIEDPDTTAAYPAAPAGSDAPPAFAPPVAPLVAPPAASQPAALPITPPYGPPAGTPNYGPPAGAPTPPYAAGATPPPYAAPAQPGYGATPPPYAPSAQPGYGTTPPGGGNPGGVNYGAPVYTGAPASGAKAPVLSIISLVAGIVGVLGGAIVIIPFFGSVLQLFIPIAAIVLGFLGKAKEPDASKGLWLTGIILGFVGLLISIIGFIFWGLIVGQYGSYDYYNQFS